MYVVGQHGSERAKALAAEGLADEDAFVRRRAAEALVRMGDPAFAGLPALYALVGDADRFVRWAGRVALEAAPRDAWADSVLAETDPTAAATGMLALVRTAREPSELEAVFEKTLHMLRSNALDVEQELGLLRVFHLACLEREGGCRSSLRGQIYDIVSARFPCADEALDREYARTMAYANRPEAIGAILARMREGGEGQQSQIHYVYCLRAIKQGWTADQKRTLLAWFGEARHWRGGASFPGFINRLFESSLEFFDEQERRAAYAAIPEYAPVDDQALLASLRRRDGHVQPNVFARKTGTNLYSEQEIFEYMMYDPMTTLATREQGLEVFEQACARCHRLGGRGEDYGPDLSTIGNRFTRRDMLEAVLWPSREISDQYGSWRIETGDDVYSAMILEEDEESVTILLPDLERPVSIPRAGIVDMRASDVSIMPEGLFDEFELRQTAGLFRLLQETAAGGSGG